MDRKSWIDFKNAGMLWWVNRILHTFGWSIVVVQNDDRTVIDVYPARTSWLGFGPETDEQRLADFKLHISGDET